MKLLLLLGLDALVLGLDLPAVWPKTERRGRIVYCVIAALVVITSLILGLGIPLDRIGMSLAGVVFQSAG